MTQTIIKVPAVGGGSFDPTDIEITDNTSGAFLIKEGSNEYMRIDTTNGSELTQFKMPFTTGEFKYMQETSAGSYPFIKCNQGMARLFPGGDGGGFNFNRVEVTTAHVHLTGSGSEVRIGNSLPVSGSGVRAFPASGHSWTELLTTGSTSKIQRVSDGLKMLEVNTDTDSTFTLDDSAGGIFKVQDDAGTPTEFLKIDSTTGARNVRLQTGHSNQYVLFNQTGWYSQFRNGNNNQVYLSGNDSMELYGKFCTHRQFAGGFFRSMNAANTIQLFAVEENSNTTFRLNASTPGKFKVQDSGAAHNYIEVDSTSGSEQIVLKGRASLNSKLVMNHDPYLQGSVGNYVQLTSSQIVINQGSATSTRNILGSSGSGNSWLIRNSGSQDIVSVKGNMDTRIRAQSFIVSESVTDTPMFEMDNSTNATFTLDSGSSATFQVKHDAMTTTYNQFFKAQEGVGTVITPGDGSSWQLNNSSTAANLNDRLVLHYYQNSYLEQHQMPKWAVVATSATSSAASSSQTFDARLGRSHSSGHRRTIINSTYSGTHAFTASLTNTLSAFSGNQNWGVTSQILRFENANTSNGATLQFGTAVGGTVKFINNSGITTGITDPVSGTQALAAKGSAAAGTYNLLIYRMTQFNTNEGSASLYDDDRYIIELLYAELI